MKTQVYNFDTRFNFGKFKGKSLTDLFEIYEERYIGFLLVTDCPFFILDPETMKILKENGFFDNLSYPTPPHINGGSIPISSFGLDKEIVINRLKNRYFDFMNDPIDYDRLAIEDSREYHKIRFQGKI